jgi:hypothetical protein
MGLLVFQQTSGGVINVVGTNTSATYTWTLPAATDTFVGLATTQTLSNKTLTAPIVGSWTTSTRPTSPVAGEFGFNTTLSQFEGYTGSAWGGLGGAQGNGVIQINNTTITASYTIASGQNGLSVGPITITSGDTVTVSNGQRWVIL